MTSTPTWGRIPFELQTRKQWLLASPDAKGDLKVPTTVTSDGRLVNGSSTDESTWLTFETACMFAAAKKLGIGYVVAWNDPFVCIDLDVKGAHNEPDQSKWTSKEQLDRFWLIAKTFNSYTEVSQSGKGLHIWVEGNTPGGDGVRHDGVEVYSRDRFLVCTGNVLFELPITPRQDLVDMLVMEIRARQGAIKKARELDNQEEVDTDEEIITRAATADNADKFNELWAGRWEQFGFPSQSEADLALMSMFTFYSRADEQCRRLFRMSALGKRDKATKDDRYLDYTLRLIRGRQEAEDAILERTKQSAEALYKKVQADSVKEYAASLGPINGKHVPDVAKPTPSPPQVETGLQWPPGFTGQLAWFFYRTAPRPVKEVAVVAALGFLAGVCGKMWNIPQSGLNIYLILVARSAVGKEAMHSGIGALLAKLREGLPSAQDFVDFSEYASGPALVKACAANPCFVNVSGEWGKKLRRLSTDDGRDSTMTTLRTAMTNLYQKSGPTSIVGGLTYSRKEDNIASISGVAYSMIGETTPGVFYDSLTESMMEDGFLSRFTVVEYAGERPPANDAPTLIPEPEIVDRCIQIMIQSKTMIQNRSAPIGVMRDADAAKIMTDFDKECDEEINKTTDESWRQMWNRAQLKMMRIAALLACADNHVQPCINKVHTEWALLLIRRDIKIMQRRFEEGDIGIGDAVRERKVLHFMKVYLAEPPGIGYKVPQGMREKGIITRSYLLMRTSRISAFTSHKLGATRALDDALKSIVDSGFIVEVDKKSLSEDFGFTGRSYRILSIPDYNEGS